MTPRTEILWRSDELSSAERCVIADLPGAASIAGTAVLPLHDAPASIDYAVDTAADWSATAARIVVTTGVEVTTMLVERINDEWRIDGVVRPDLASCTTVDLGWSPATNTLPLRATPLAVGESAAGHAAWLRFPELDVVASEQTYTRLASNRVRYSSATFTADLAMADLDVVRTYGDALWHADTLNRCV